MCACVLCMTLFRVLMHAVGRECVCVCIAIRECNDVSMCFQAELAYSSDTNSYSCMLTMNFKPSL